MAVIGELKKAFGLAESATAKDVQSAFERLLQDEMTPEEKAEMERRRAEMERMKQRQDEDQGMMGELRSLLGLQDTAGLGAVVGAMRALKGPSASLSERFTAHDAESARLTLEVRKLSEEIEALKPAAAQVKELREASVKRERDVFFAEQIRTGKMPPKDREFFEGVWAKDPEQVKGYFKDRKPVVHLAERGLDGEGEQAAADDPRIVLNEKALARATEKGIPFMQALSEVTTEHPELAENYAGTVGVAGLRR